MPDSHKNFIITTVATAPSPATSGTSLVVSAGFGANFPAAPFNMTVWPPSVEPSLTNAEIVRVTAISTDTLTIQRAQESTTARSIAVGDQIAMTITAKSLTDIETTMVIAPGTNTADFIPQWNGADSKTLKNGVAMDTAATASAIAQRDGNANLFANGLQSGYATTTATGGSTTLTAASAQLQYFTGFTSQTVTLPDVSTLTLGFRFIIGNFTTSNVTVKSSGGTTVSIVPGGKVQVFTCILTSGTSNASWQAAFTEFLTTTGFGNVVLSSSATLLSPTLQTPNLGTPTSGNLSNCTGFPVKAWVRFTGTAANSTANVTGTYLRTSPSTTATITVTGHGYVAGNVIYCTIQSGTMTGGKFTVVSVIDANNFTITSGASTTTSGNLTLLRKPILASNGVSSVTYLNGAGLFSVNFSSGAIADSNYSAPIGNCQCAGIAGLALGASGGIHTANAFDCTTVSIVAITTAADPTSVELLFVR